MKKKLSSLKIRLFKIRYRKQCVFVVHNKRLLQSVFRRLNECTNNQYGKHAVFAVYDNRMHQFECSERTDFFFLSLMIELSHRFAANSFLKCGPMQQHQKNWYYTFKQLIM